MPIISRQYSVSITYYNGGGTTAFGGLYDPTLSLGIQYSVIGITTLSEIGVSARANLVSKVSPSVLLDYAVNTRNRLSFAFPETYLSESAIDVRNRVANPTAISAETNLSVATNFGTHNPASLSTLAEVAVNNRAKSSNAYSASSLISATDGVSSRARNAISAVSERLATTSSKVLSHVRATTTYISLVATDARKRTSKKYSSSIQSPNSVGASNHAYNEVGDSGATPFTFIYPHTTTNGFTLTGTPIAGSTTITYFIPTDGEFLGSEFVFQYSGGGSVVIPILSQISETVTRTGAPYSSATLATPLPSGLIYTSAYVGYPPYPPGVEVTVDTRATVMPRSVSANTANFQTSARSAAFVATAVSALNEVAVSTRATYKYFAIPASLIPNSASSSFSTRTHIGVSAEVIASASSRLSSYSKAPISILTEIQTSKRSIMATRRGVSAETMVQTSKRARNSNKTGITQVQNIASSQRQSAKLRAVASALRETAVGVRSLAHSEVASSSLFEVATSTYFIHLIIVTAPIIFQDAYDTLTQQDAGPSSFAETANATFTETAAPVTFEDGGVSSYSERKWNNT